MPTINQIYPEGYQLPRYGIYITRTWIKGRAYPSATGLGTRPTVNDDSTKVTCETFIPGFYGDLYGTDPVVEFHTYLSPSKKFDTLDELRDCIRTPRAGPKNISANNDRPRHGCGARCFMCCFAFRGQRCDSAGPGRR